MIFFCAIVFFLQGTFLCDRLFFCKVPFRYILCAGTAQIRPWCSQYPPREAVHPNPHFQDALFSEIESEILSEIQSGIILEILSGIFRRRSRRKIRSTLAQLNNDLIGDECRRLNQEIDKRFFWRLIWRF